MTEMKTLTINGSTYEVTDSSARTELSTVATFTPSVDEAGNLSWTNTKGLENPATVNIKGPEGVGVKRVNAAERNFTTANWRKYGTPGHEENWNAPIATYDNSHLAIGDSAYVVGTISDEVDAQGNHPHAAVYGVVIAINDTSVRMRSSHVILSGGKGDKGDPGDPGPSYTLTDNDKTTIVNQVIAALPTWEGGSY